MVASAPSLVGSLPIPRTRLIGREVEISTARSFLLEEAVPLLTLTGPGGVGKTRLALAIALDVAENFADGVVWVDLAPLADAALVPATVAAALAYTPTPDQPITAELARYLRSRQTLFLLDNCEHVLRETADLVSTLLDACPALQVLATSRASLHLHGEQVLAVPPLSVPAHGATGLDRVQDIPAVQLFVQRARGADAQFVLDDGNASVISEVCQRLDGLPLALELAAARVKVLSPQALAARLAQRLPLLTGGPRDARARHQTMHHAIAWSYDLLAPDEQALFRRLGVFVGGWTLEAAEAVASPAGGVNVLDGLWSLIDKSLVLRTDPKREGAPPRFAMLETVRDFALELLSGSDEDAEIRDRHAAWCLAFGEAAEPHVDGHGRDTAWWMARVDAGAQQHANGNCLALGAW